MTHAPDPARLRALLGDQIGAVTIADAARHTRREIGDWALDDLALTTSDGQEIPAFFLHRPDTGTPDRAVIYCHAHGNTYGVGRDELVAGRGALQSPYLDDLIDLNIAALCLEMPCFGARQAVTESAAAKAGLWSGKPLFGRMLAELSAGLDWLCDQPGIDAARIGATGISMGGTHAWWLAALAPRIKAVAHLCCFADLGHLVASGDHDKHGIYMMVPGLLPVARSGQIAGLIAPRPQLVCAGMQDWSTPPDCLEIALADLRAAYDDAGAADALHTHIEADLGHAESAAMRAATLAFLDRAL